MGFDSSRSMQSMSFNERFNGSLNLEIIKDSAHSESLLYLPDVAFRRQASFYARAALRDVFQC